VSGFNVEYRAGLFALIFIAEYINILFIRLLSAIIFIGSINLLSDIQLIAKTIILATLFVWIRATLPRIRYDNLIYLTWKRFLPLSLAAIIALALILSL
jgi:NADH:ubiquinone oxidoreductase subunit H